MKNQTQIPWLYVNNCILIQSLENVQDFTCYYNRFNLHENVQYNRCTPEEKSSVSCIYNKKWLMSFSTLTFSEECTLLTLF